jgi:multisubunit Na+/H+ antiporter MnhE subunit
MLETLIVLLVLFWLLGMISSYTIGGLIHVLLVVALVVLVIRVIQGRRVV